MSPETPSILVRHNEADQRFEAQVEAHLAFLSYTREGDRHVFDHTFVPDALRGRGVAAVLVRAALKEARERGWRITPRCSYVAAFINRHPEHADLQDSSEAT